MTTATLTPSPLDGIRLKFGGVLRSEWIKLRSLRSTLSSRPIVLPPR